MSTVDGGEIQKAAGVLHAGGLVAVPTETVYGLGANAEDLSALARVFQVKGRPPTHPLIVHIGAADQLDQWVRRVPETARLLAERFWPGPLTLVLTKAARVPLEVTGGLQTVAVRVPAHPVTLKLLETFGGGIAAPSANRFGSVSPTTAADVTAELGDRVDMVLDGGACTVGVESTIVDLTGDTPALLRPGGVPREDLQRLLGHAVPDGVTGGPRVPGQHPSHYAPNARVQLVDPHRLVVEAELAAGQGLRVGVLLPPDLPLDSVKAHAVVPVPALTADYARVLFGLLRELDRQGCEVILACLPDERGLGAAIANRLRRAAGPKPAR